MQVKFQDRTMQRRVLKSQNHSKNLSYLSPYHQKFQIQRQSIKNKQIIQSIYLMGHLQKMELNAINNRSLRTNMVSKKAQRMYKKIFQPKYIFSPQKQQIKIDNRSKQKQKIYASSLRKMDNQFNRACQILINQYIQKAKNQELLLKSQDKKKIIDQTCSEIKQKLKRQFPKLSLEQSQGIANKIDKQYLRSSLPYIPHAQKKLKKSRIKRSITEIECSQNIVKLKNEQSYFSKQRQNHQKSFLRKMKMIDEINKHNRTNNKGFSQRNRRLKTEVQKLGYISSGKKIIQLIKLRPI